MHINQYISNKKKIQKLILVYIESNDESSVSYQNLIHFFQTEKILGDREKLREYFHFISKICKNHHRHTNFISNIEQILLYLFENIKQSFSNSEIFHLFKSNKIILLFFI